MYMYNIDVFMCVHTHTHTRTRTHMFIYPNIHTYMHAYIHTYIHTYMTHRSLRDNGDTRGVQDLPAPSSHLQLAQAVDAGARPHQMAVGP